ncbi:hypothetical protein ACFFHJ_24255 [Planotetraspora thailandica]|uniref:hypothetical protein n=1 Tax=Planotetraspora thailandica TaxID=487172 RepID=UPI0019526BCD|nr:hypothetical protein [Planotetraspora thailandica]
MPGPIRASRAAAAGRPPIVVRASPADLPLVAPVPRRPVPHRPASRRPARRGALRKAPARQAAGRRDPLLRDPVSGLELQVRPVDLVARPAPAFRERAAQPDRVVPALNARRR